MLIILLSFHLAKCKIQLQHTYTLLFHNFLNTFVSALWRIGILFLMYANQTSPMRDCLHSEYCYFCSSSSHKSSIAGIWWYITSIHGMISGWLQPQCIPWFYINDGTIFSGWHWGSSFIPADIPRHVSTSTLKSFILLGSISIALHSRNLDCDVWLAS